MLQQTGVSYKEIISSILLAGLLVWGPMILLMYMTVTGTKDVANYIEVFPALSEQGYFMSDLTVSYCNQYPDKKFQKVISADDGDLSVKFMAFEDTESAETEYYNILNEVSSKLIQNGEMKLDSAGSHVSFQYYKLETDKNYAHIMRIKNTIAVADSPITRKDEIISVMNKLGYNYDIPMDKTGFIGSKQFSNIAFMFFAVSLPICFLCRKMYFVELCKVCGKKRWEVQSKKIEIVANSTGGRIRQSEFEEWMYRETLEKYKAKRLMSLYTYFCLPSIIFLIFAFAFRKNGMYNMILLAGMAIISAMFIYTVIFTLKNGVIKKWIHQD